MNDEMTDFEQRLQQAMQRVDAPPALLQFLAAATEASQDRALPRSKRRHRWASLLPSLTLPSLTLPHPRLWATGAIAALLAVGVFAGEQVHRQREQARADQQFLTAMRITNTALDQTREQLQRAGIRLND